MTEEDNKEKLELWAKIDLAEAEYKIKTIQMEVERRKQEQLELKLKFPKESLLRMLAEAEAKLAHLQAHEKEFKEELSKVAETESTWQTAMEQDPTFQEDLK